MKHEAEPMTACRQLVACRSAKCQLSEAKAKHEVGVNQACLQFRASLSANRGHKSSNSSKLDCTTFKARCSFSKLRP